MQKLALVLGMTLCVVSCSQTASQVRDNAQPAGPREEAAPAVGAPTHNPSVMPNLATPFPLPRTVPMSDTLRSDVGVVAWLAPDRSTVDMLMADGIVTYQLTGGTHILDIDGRAVGTDALSQGQHMRVYFLIDDGAKVLEMDPE